MKALTTFTTLTNIASSGAATGFPASNVSNLDPGIYWKADAYAGAVSVVAQIGAGITAIFLNRCNFPLATFQWNATNSWGSPTVSTAITLVKDDAGNRKGWFAVTGTSPGFIRILITASQSLDLGATLPVIGNLICGTSIAFPVVSGIRPVLVQKRDSFLSRGGSYSELKRGYARHTISIEIVDALATVRAMDKTWAYGVLWADLANAGDAWLVYAPGNWDKPFESGSDSKLSFTVEEKA
jgi:hypothetical protein